MRRAVLVLLTVLTAVSAAQAQPVALPSAGAPNEPGSIVVPFSLSTPPAVPERRSYPELLSLWRSAGSAYGVPWEVLGAINKLESSFGRNLGPSSAGALGWMQFLPDTWMRWGLDADGDGVANPWDPEDAIYAAARYLAAAGAQEDLARAIFAYNHADWYVRDVLAMAQVFAAGGGVDPALASPLGTPGLVNGAQTVFRLDQLQERLSDARRAVTRAQREVTAAEDALARLEAAVLAAERRAGDPALSDAEFQALERDVTGLVLERDAAIAALARARDNLKEVAERARALGEQVDAEATTVGFTTQPLANGFGEAQFSGRYVFPVGGGPSAVSVAATHHDYPAADIAAPEGAPLYALADSVVTRSFPSEHGKCGIGFELALADGKRYVYCHLSYLEPHVVPGAALSAGTPVGLVGSTGNATGPHLHLARIPSSSYPQHEAWFRSFGGVAFSWDGDPPP